MDEEWEERLAARQADELAFWRDAFIAAIGAGQSAGGAAVIADQGTFELHCRLDPSFLEQQMVRVSQTP